MEQDWKEVALWLADCEAATLEHLKTLKSSSKSEVSRHKSICEKLLRYIKDGWPVEKPSLKEWVINRLEDAVS